MQRAAHGQQGFTLLEVLIAVVILGLSYVAVLQNFSQSMSNILRLDRSRSRAVQSAIDFGRELQEMGIASQGGAGGEIFMEGAQYRLVKTVSRDGGLATLRLEKRD